MPHDQRAGPSGEASGWASAGWFALVVVGAGLAWAFCLPVMSSDPFAPLSAESVFRVEWFLAATALAVFIWHAAKASWLVGILSTLITSAQMFSIADEGADRLQHVGVVTAVTDLLYLGAVCQILLFAAAGVGGVRRNLADRRLAKLVAQLAALDPAPRKA